MRGGGRWDRPARLGEGKAPRQAGVVEGGGHRWRYFFLSLFRLSWPVQSLWICVAFLLVGAAIVGDYGPGWDTPDQRNIAGWNLAYIMGDTNRPNSLAAPHDRFYGVAFELPLLLLERGLGLEDSRGGYLLRHLVTHGFFLVGGWCCALLVYRMSRSRGVALVALLLFVVQPRLYAHSFFNSKDIPFLSMFMVTLYVTHRAFRTETVGAFVLCGVSVGVLTNLRIMGVMLYPAVLALRGLDLGQASRRGEERKHVLMTGAAFALAGPGMLYALSPYLWANPVEFVTAWQDLADRMQETALRLFQGRVDSHHLPYHYIPVWMGISTPPVTLLCGVLGVIGVGWRSFREPRAAWGNTDLRFGLLLVACLTLPVLAIIALGSTLFDTWRHVYFLHAPLCGLAGLGVQWAGRKGRLAAGVYALVGLGMLATGREMVRLHPHQQVYFNALVDRTTPEYLRTHYTMDPWKVSCREGLDFLRRRYPDTTVTVYMPVRGVGWIMLPPADRGWLVPVRGEGSAELTVVCGSDLQKSKGLSLENALYVRKVYNSTLLTVRARVTVPDRQRRVAHRVENTYRGAVSGRLVRTAPFDVYTYPGSRLLGYARRGCTGADVESAFFVHVVAEDERALPAARRQYGFENRDFLFFRRGKRVGGECWTTVELPAYEIARIRTGQYDAGGKLWEVELAGPLP